MFPFHVGQTIFFRGPRWHHIGTLCEKAADGSWFRLDPHILVSSYISLVTPLGSFEGDSYELLDPHDERLGRIPVNSASEAWDCRLYPFELPSYPYVSPQYPLLEIPELGFEDPSYRDFPVIGNLPKDPYIPKIGENVFFQGPRWHHIGTLTEWNTDALWLRLSPVVLVIRSYEFSKLRPGQDSYRAFKEVVVSTPTEEPWSFRPYAHPIPLKHAR
jgi:hypothetical protein